MLHEIRPFQPSDAETLAQMWNESDSVWPGGFTHGVPFTAERVLHWQENERSIVTFIAFVDGKAVGYCSLTEFWEDPRVAYVRLLGAHPAYHGQGIGRDLLRASLRRSVDLGYDRLDLHTWAGNLKAVPLYKKTGFFWLPGTSVHMHNYLPTVFKVETARRFFRFGSPGEVDWYSAFRRDLGVHPDEWEEHGMRVFPYEFVADGRRLRVLIDLEARSVTAVETDDFAISAWRTTPRAPRGVAARVAIEVCNHRPSAGPLSAMLLVRGDPGIQAAWRETLAVASRETVDVLAVPDQTTKAPLDYEPAPAVRTTAVLGGEVVELATGLRVTPPVEVSVPGGCVVLRPGVGTPIALLLKSSLSSPVRLALRLTGSPDLTVTPAVHEVDIPAEGVVGVRVTVTAAVVGAHTLGAAVEIQGAEPSAQPAGQSVPVHAVELGAAVSSIGEREAYLTSAELVVVAHRRGGSIDVADVRSGARICRCDSNLGPPFGPTTLNSSDFDIRFEQVGERVTIVLAARPAFLPGCLFERRVELSPGGVLRFSHRLTNGSGEPHSPAVQLGLRMGLDGARFAAPLASGLIVDEALAFPDWPPSTLHEPGAFAEPWTAFESDGLAVGIVWERIREFEIPWESHGFEATLDLGEIAPGQSVDSASVWLLVTPGDWRAVRRFWRSHLAPSAAPATPTPRRALDLRLEPPLLLDGAPRLTLTHARSRALAGTLSLGVPEGVTVEPTEMPIDGLKIGTPFEADVRVTWSTPGPHAVEGTARAALGFLEPVFPIALVRAGDPTSIIRVAESFREGQRVVTVDNGFLRFSVGPDHGGSLFDLRDGEVSHLLTSFPTPEPHQELNPWFGGITPQVWTSPGYHQSRPMAARSYQWSESSRVLLGQTWSGLRLSAEVDREHLRGLGIEVEYLTLGGSNLVALVVRLDTHGAPLHATPGLFCFPAPEGSTTGTTAHFRRHDLYSRRQTGGIESQVDGWCALESEASGRCLVAFTDDPGTALSIDHDEQYLRFFVQSRPESALAAEAEGRPVEAIAYLAIARSVAEARAYRLLGRG